MTLSGGELTVGSGYVTAYAPGGIVSTTASGLQTTIQLYAGHGFAANDRFLVGAVASTHNPARKVNSTTSTSITIDVGLTNPTIGDRLINIGPDTGSPTPNYNASTITTYSGPSTAAPTNTNAQVTISSAGGFEYWHQASGIWELIRDTTGAPVGYNLDIISNVFGALTVSGAATVGSLTSSGAISGTTITGSGAVTGASLATSGGGSITGGAISGTTGTFSSTLGVTGASTLTGGVAGGAPYNCSTVGSYVVATVGSGLTPSTTFVYVGSIIVPYNCTVTGIQYMRGSATATTEKVIVALFNSAGTPVANSATAGTTVTTTASLVQRVPFTATYAAVGPKLYYIGVYFNTATANLFQVLPVASATNVFDGGVVGEGISGQTFGTVAAITPPTAPPSGGVARIPLAAIY